MVDKNVKKFADNLMAFVGFFLALGLGGLFVAGGFTQVAILSWLPLIVHQIFGWTLIAGTIWTALLKFMR